MINCNKFYSICKKNKFQVYKMTWDVKQDIEFFNLDLDFMSFFKQFWFVIIYLG